jgi:His-Xaa-Ser system radical SAM maturase HxsC
MATRIEANVTRSLKMDDDLVLRLTRRDVANPEDHAFVLAQAPHSTASLHKYAAVVQPIEEKVLVQHRIIIKLSYHQLDMLAEGDIVRVPSSGNFVSSIYRMGSRNNVLFVTNDCNCRCVLCPQKSLEADPPNNLEMILKQIELMDKSVEWLGITGGEPTVLKHDLIQILDKCRTALPDTNVLLLSNGMEFSDAGFCEQIGEAKPTRLTVAVTLYSDFPRDHDWTTGVPGNFFRTSEGIHRINHVGVPVEVRVVVSKRNCDRLPQIARYLYMNFPFAIHIAFMGLEMSGYAAENSDEVWIEPPKFEAALGLAVDYLRRRNRAVSVYNLPLCMVPEEIRSFARQSISDYKNVYHELCEGCVLKSQCAGFFSSSVDLYAPYIERNARTLDVAK